MANTQPHPLETKSKPRAPLKLKQVLVTKPPVTKSEQIVTLLRRTKGASIIELMKATGWQHHSVRGFLSGTVVKQKGLKLASQKKDQRRYRVIVAETAS